MREGRELRYAGWWFDHPQHGRAVVAHGWSDAWVLSQPHGTGAWSGERREGSDVDTVVWVSTTTSRLRAEGYRAVEGDIGFSAHSRDPAGIAAGFVAELTATWWTPAAAEPAVAADAHLVVLWDWESELERRPWCAATFEPLGAPTARDRARDMALWCFTGDGADRAAAELRDGWREPAFSFAAGRAPSAPACQIAVTLFDPDHGVQMGQALAAAAALGDQRRS